MSLAFNQISLLFIFLFFLFSQCKDQALPLNSKNAVFELSLQSILQSINGASTFECYILNCQSCSTPTTCQQCPPSGNCCSAFCTVCENNVCQQCQDGFALSSNLTYNLCIVNNACLSSTYGCLNCGGTNNCIQCKNGTYYEASINICYPCSSNCSQCSGITQCTSCINGFYTSNNACLACIASCTSCTNSSSCLTCLGGMYYESQYNECLSCSLSCQVCTNATFCSSCKFGFFMQNGLCLPCTARLPFCDACSSNAQGNSLFCLACTDGYYSAALNNCQPCTLFCKICTATSCSKCFNGFYLTSYGSCAKCQISSCQSCNLTQCLQCNAGYWMNVTGNCVACGGENCGLCSGNNACQQCKRGFFLNQQLLCSPCADKCIDCIGSALNCSLCIPGYYTNDLIAPGLDTCLKCSNPCAICSSLNSCSACDVGYFRDILQYDSFDCHYCMIMDCASCYLLNTSHTICAVCKPGFYLQNNTCQKCTITACSICANVSPTNQTLTCSQCQVGFGLKVYTNNNTNACLACPLNCNVCPNAGNCTICKQGYYRSQNSLCVKCSNNCSLCTLLGCSQCSGSFYLDSSIGGNQNNSCRACPSPCITCVSELLCSSCLVKNYLSNNGQCYPCNPLCETCLEYNNCYTCASSAYLLNSACLPCPDNCLLCTLQNSNLVCKTCDQDYEMTNDGCVSQYEYSSGMPWWAILLIVLVVFIVLLAVVMFVRDYQQKHKLQNQRGSTGEGGYVEMANEQSN